MHAGVCMCSLYVCVLCVGMFAVKLRYVCADVGEEIVNVSKANIIDS